MNFKNVLNSRKRDVNAIIHIATTPTLKSKSQKDEEHLDNVMTTGLNHCIKGVTG